MKAAVREFENTILSLSPIHELNYERTYNATSLLLIFFSFSGLGWVWEVLLHIIEDGMFINRGVMTGPWLPIYGFGGVIILIALKKWRRKPLQTLVGIMLVCGITEYVTSLFLEVSFGAKWWDYSDMLFSFQGRVCLEGLLIFGIGGLFFIYILAPRMDNRISQLSHRTKTAAVCILVIIFTADLVHTLLNPNMGFGITS